MPKGFRPGLSFTVRGKTWKQTDPGEVMRWFDSDLMRTTLRSQSPFREPYLGHWWCQMSKCKQKTLLHNWMFLCACCYFAMHRRKTEPSCLCVRISCDTYTTHGIAQGALPTSLFPRPSDRSQSPKPRRALDICWNIRWSQFPFASPRVLKPFMFWNRIGVSFFFFLTWKTVWENSFKLPMKGKQIQTSLLQ